MTQQTSTLEPFVSYDVPELNSPNPGYNRTIGGSSLAAILGVSPWESPYEAWLKLTRRVGATPDNPAMARGRKWEPIIATVFEATHQEYRATRLNPATSQPWFVRHTDYDFLTGQPDRMLHGLEGFLTDAPLEAGLEIKTASWRTIQNWGSEGTDQVPQNYLLQSNWYAGLMRVPEWHLIVQFFRENESGQEVPYLTREYLIPFDRELHDICVGRAVQFWNDHVVADVQPEIDSVGETFVRYVREAFPKNFEPIAEATPDEEEIIEAVMAAKKAADEAAANFEVAKAKAQAAIGERDGLYSERLGKITWKCSKDRDVTDWKGIVKGVGVSEQVIKEYTETKPGSRTFLLSPKKN